MGSGKSTAGKKLSKLLRLRFIDLDYYIEQKEKLSVQSIFDNFGESVFRKMEQTSLNEIITNQKNTVVSLGGGTVCYENNLELIKSNGLLIFIELPAESIAYRLEKSKVQRPLINNLKGAELVGFINEKLNQRKNFYDKSHLTVSGLNVTPQILQQKIIEFKNKNI